MKEIKCPKCGEIIEIDNELYNSIADDIRKTDIIKQNYEKRFVEIQFKINVFNSLIKDDIRKNKHLNKEEKEKQISKLKAEIKDLEKEKDLISIKLNNLNLEF